MSVVIGAEQERRVFTETIVVHIALPGEPGKLFTNINANLQPHPDKPLSAFLFVKLKVFKTSYAPLLQEVLGPGWPCSHVLPRSIVGNGTLLENNPQPDTQNQCQALWQLL